MTDPRPRCRSLLLQQQPRLLRLLLGHLLNPSASTGRASQVLLLVVVLVVVAVLVVA
jgi:hypothetical protein